jgi:hypothetical protein
MYVTLAITITAIISVVIGYSIEQAYGQSNMTAATNMTTGNMTTGTEDDNTTKGSVSGGLAVSDPGASGSKK